MQGWMPQSIIDTALSFAMCDYVRYIRAFAVKCHEEGKFWFWAYRLLYATVL